MNSPVDLTGVRPHGPTPIRIVIVYENRNAALRAKHTLDHVADSFAGEIAFETDVWSFGMFRAPQLRDFVMRDAGKANLVVVAAEGTAAIPLEVMTGLQVGNPPAVALLTMSNENAGLPAIRTQLQLLAREKSFEVVHPEPEPAVDQASRDTRTFSRMVQPPLMEALFEPTHDDDHRWGINE
jgi:hypothetical protein